MSAVQHTSPAQLAELLMIAASTLAEPDPNLGSVVPIGIPVRRGRLHLGRLHTLFETSEPVVVGVGFATACWLGRRGMPMPELGRLCYSTETDLDQRGRVVLDRRVRAWLGVDDPMCFDVVTAPTGDGGVLIVPVAGFAKRWKAIS
ncbi:MAG: hypothetical protein JWL72_1408 [Ilumatobacteraceae bacterium]|nr:hypothetical protein [Ilumatobacteraceae bacterium]